VPPLALRVERERRKFSMHDVSLPSGVGVTTISDTERGRYKPTTETVIKLAHALGISSKRLYQMLEAPAEAEPVEAIS